MVTDEEVACFWDATFAPSGVNSCKPTKSKLVRTMLKVFINEESYFTLDQLNERIKDFDYGYYNDRNKPSPYQSL